MKKVISLILILAHLTAVFHFTVPYLSYFTNFNYFATEACVNKDNPHIECNGACQLDKMVHQQHQDKKDAPATHNVERVPKVVFFFQGSYGPVPFIPRDVDGSLSTEVERYSSIWHTEPLSPPPQTA